MVCESKSNKSNQLCDLDQTKSEKLFCGVWKKEKKQKNKKQKNKKA
jgi:hypothetical protein